MRLPRPTAVDALTTAAALACPGVLFVVAGPPGAVVGGAAVVAWLVAPVYGFALGQFGLVAAAPELAVSPRLLVAQAALVALLLLGFLRERRSAVGSLVLVGLAVALTGAVLAGIDAGVETPVLAVGLAGVVAPASYVLHRYELVVLGSAGSDVGRPVGNRDDQ